MILEFHLVFSTYFPYIFCFFENFEFESQHSLIFASAEFQKKCAPFVNPERKLYDTCDVPWSRVSNLPMNCVCQPHDITSQVRMYPQPCY
jgi:hypothetical protein